jgi:hypothetical protein
MDCKLMSLLWWNHKIIQPDEAESGEPRRLAYPLNAGRFLLLSRLKTGQRILWLLYGTTRREEMKIPERWSGA